jgi:hypothetical protein
MSRIPLIRHVRVFACIQSSAFGQQNFSLDLKIISECDTDKVDRVAVP